MAYFIGNDNCIGEWNLSEYTYIIFAILHFVNWNKYIIHEKVYDETLGIFRFE